MRKTTDTYSFATTDIQKVRELLEKTFRIQFVPHESYHRGEYYLSKPKDWRDETMTLEQNILFEGELHHPALPENTVVLSIGSTTRGTELRVIVERLGGTLIECTTHE